MALQVISTPVGGKLLFELPFLQEGKPQGYLYLKKQQQHNYKIKYL